VTPTRTHPYTHNNSNTRQEENNDLKSRNRASVEKEWEYVIPIS